MKPSEWVGWSSAMVHEYIEHKVSTRSMDDINQKLDYYIPRYDHLISCSFAARSTKLHCFVLCNIM